ncbi:MAG: M20/M25/M40 family metallo-hydrolase [Actinomycetia bacterium]|nr:M20/M25/M40 family metallo-hydrolase [Actinomycetes bacterium]
MKWTTKIAIGAAGTAAVAATVATTRRGSEPRTADLSIRTRGVAVEETGVDGDAFLTHLAEAIRLPTVAFEEQERNDPQEILAVHEFLRTAYPLVHERFTVETINDLSLLFTWEGTDRDADPLLLMAHMDVVPIEPGTENGWDVEPFAGKVVDGYLWGRGTIDDKGPLIAIMEATEHLIQVGFQPRRTVMISFGHDEEIGGTQGARRVADALVERDVAPWFVIDEGGAVTDELPPLTTRSVALVKTAEKGTLSLKLTASGEGGHSSAPPSESTIGALAVAIQQLEKHQMPARVQLLEPMFAALSPYVDPKMRPILTNLRFTGRLVERMQSRSPVGNAGIRTTTAVTIVSGGVKSNVLPQEAYAVVNCRILPGDTIQNVLDHVRKVVGPDIAIEPYGEIGYEPGPVSSTESDAWHVLATSIEETFPEAIVTPWTWTGATDSRHFAAFSGDVYGFAPFTGSDGEFARIHGTGERVRTSDAERAVSFFCRLIRNAC